MNQHPDGLLVEDAPEDPEKRAELEAERRRLRHLEREPSLKNKMRKALTEEFPR